MKVIKINLINTGYGGRKSLDFLNTALLDWLRMKFSIRHNCNFIKIVLNYNFANVCRYEVAVIKAYNNIYRLNLRIFLTNRTLEKLKKVAVIVFINVCIYLLKREKIANR